MRADLRLPSSLRKLRFLFQSFIDCANAFQNLVLLNK